MKLGGTAVCWTQTNCLLWTFCWSNVTHKRVLSSCHVWKAVSSVLTTALLLLKYISRDVEIQEFYSITCISNIDNTLATKKRQAIIVVRQKPLLPTARSPRRWWISRPQNLEDHPDHQWADTNAPYEKVFTPLDILTFLTFYIWDHFFTENFADFTIFIFIFNVITCIRTTSRSTDLCI
jgi:hypothetical protein